VAQIPFKRNNVIILPFYGFVRYDKLIVQIADNR
jgi:hypothetical protein